MIRLAVFDLWGTLFWHDGWKALRDKYGIKGKIGNLIMKEPLTSQQTAERLAKKFGIETDPKELAEEIEQAAGTAKPVPGALETLELLREKGIKLGLCSNTFQTAFQALDRRWGLRKRFDCVFLSYERGVLKPDPRALLHCPQALCVSPEETVMVGDKLHLDVIPTQELGMTGVLFDPENEHPEFRPRITKIREIVGLIGVQRVKL